MNQDRVTKKIPNDDHDIHVNPIFDQDPIDDYETHENSSSNQDPIYEYDIQNLNLCSRSSHWSINPIYEHDCEIKDDYIHSLITSIPQEETFASLGHINSQENDMDPNKHEDLWDKIDHIELIIDQIPHM